MVVLVIGPNGSGKSAYAENLVMRLCKTKSAAAGSVCAAYYAATMIPYGEEGAARVERHRKQRRSLGFITFEEPYRVSGMPLPPDCAVLLEDVTNLLANNLFGRKNGKNNGGYNDTVSDNETDADLCAAVFEDITRMCAKCASAVLVTIGGLTASDEYDAETRKYVDGINRLNGLLTEYSDAVVSMADGEPILMKGTFNAQA